VVAGLALSCGAAFPGHVAGAATNVVTNCKGSGRGSLAAVVKAAPAGATVLVSVSCPPTDPIVLSSTIAINVNLSIEGLGAGTLAVSRNNSVGVFDIGTGVTATISGVTIENGHGVTSGSFSQGGGIFNYGSLTVADTTVSDNSADFGGGIYSNGTLTVSNSTVSDNTASNGWGGGVLSDSGATSTITDSTVADNNSNYDGGGIFNDGITTVSDSTVSNNTAHNGGGLANEGTMTVSDSTVAQNSATSDGGGVFSYIQSGPTSVTNSTVSGNGAVTGGGIDNSAAVTLGASIVANSSAGGDCVGVAAGLTDDGDNLDDDGSCGFVAGTDHSDASSGLDPAGLQDNGGPTQTIALEPGSPAIGAVNDAAACSTSDQRGVARPTPCDIGSYQSAKSTTVTNCSGSASTPGSLPYEVANAVSGDTINFALSPSCSVITLASTIDIGANMIIAGPGANALAVSGGGAVGVFSVGSGWTVSIAGLTIDDGNSPAGGGIANEGGAVSVTASTFIANHALEGGGISNLGTVTVADSTFSGNSADSGGGIYNQDGSFTVAESTFFDNSATDGGAIDNDNGTVSVTGSTISGNSASLGTDPQGGGIFNVDGTISLAATILSDSEPNAACHDGGSGTISDAGYNVDDDSCGFSAANHSLSNVNPDLGLPENNGGPTETLVPALDSAALNRIPPGTNGNGVTLCPGTDQRGVARPQGTQCDIGAVELVLPPRSFTSPNSANVTAGSAFSFAVTTQGTPAPSIARTGKLPRGLHFVNNHNGSATIAGTTAKSGVYAVTLSAGFGTGKTKVVVTQSFTLFVDTS